MDRLQKTLIAISNTEGWTMDYYSAVLGTTDGFADLPSGTIGTIAEVCWFADWNDMRHVMAFDYYIRKLAAGEVACMEL